jgi:hypothetical protein
MSDSQKRPNVRCNDIWIQKLRSASCNIPKTNHITRPHSGTLSPNNCLPVLFTSTPSLNYYDKNHRTMSKDALQPLHSPHSETLQKQPARMEHHISRVSSWLTWTEIRDCTEGNGRSSSHASPCGLSTRAAIESGGRRSRNSCGHRIWGSVSVEHRRWGKRIDKWGSTNDKSSSGRTSGSHRRPGSHRSRRQTSWNHTLVTLLPHLIQIITSQMMHWYKYAAGSTQLDYEPHFHSIYRSDTWTASSNARLSKQASNSTITHATRRHILGNRAVGRAGKNESRITAIL